MKKTEKTTEGTIKSGTSVTHKGEIMEGIVGGSVNPSRVNGRTDCVWVLWTWGRTKEIASELEVVE